MGHPSGLLGISVPAARLLLQIHDELVFEVREDLGDQLKALVKRCMQEVVPRGLLAVPLRVSIHRGRKWGEME